MVFLLSKFSIGISEEKLKVKRPQSERVIAGIFVMQKVQNAILLLSTVICRLTLRCGT